MKSHGKSKAVIAAVIFEVNLLQSSRFGEAKRLEHHAEGIWEEYSFLRDVSVSVEDITEKDAG